MKLNVIPNLILLLFGLILASCTEKKSNPIRILTGGIRHESNTFNPLPTTTAYFTIKRGEKALEGQAWSKYLQEAGVEIIPTVHTNANPFGVVARNTYDGFKDEILEGLKKAGKVDGIYLDLHGALHVEGISDAQLDLIRSIREITGEEVLIAGSFDLHGNMSREFVDELDILTAYRTAPHVDGPETQQRAVKLLLDAIQQNLKPVISYVKVPILIPGEKGITSAEPLKSLYAQLPSLAAKEGLLDASIFVGMPWTDVARAGMSLQVVAAGAEYLEMANAETTRLADELWNSRMELQFDVPTDSFEGAVKTALSSRESTVFITDSGDNTTAGAAGDNTLVLDHLISLGITNAVVAGIVDPEAVNVCEQAGIGAEVNLIIGGKLDTLFDKSLEIAGKVKYLTTDPKPDMPNRRPVVLEVEGIQLVLLNEVRSFTSPADFEEVAINPLEYKIVVVKLGYLFQGLRDIAPHAIMALTPGFANQVIESLPYQHIPRPIYPLDEDMEWKVK